MAGEAELGMRVAGSPENLRSKLEPLLCRDHFQNRLCNLFGLAKAALLSLLKERHGNDKNAGRGKRRFRRVQAFAQPASKHMGGRTDSVVFQQIDQFPQPSVIASVGDGPLKRPLGATAERVSLYSGVGGQPVGR